MWVLWAGCLLAGHVYSAPGELRASLPPTLANTWQVVARDDVRPFGTGTSEAEVFDDNKREVYVYALPSDDPAPAFNALRARVASVFYAHDKTVGWSQEARFRSLSGWERNLLTAGRLMPMNASPARFADERGVVSPAWELASLAAHILVPQELLSGSKEGELPKAHCKWLSHATFLREKLAQLDPAFVPPLGEANRKCRAFEAWARVSEVRQVEIALAAPSARAAGALFGHLFLRVVYDEELEWPSLHSRAWAFLANTRGGLEDDPFYAFKGVFGLYQAQLYEKTFDALYREYAVQEAREIRRFGITLSAVEVRRLLQRLWTTRNTAAYAYFFFRQNCASLLTDLLRSVLDSPVSIEHAGLLGLTPTSALDGLAFATTHDGTSRLRYLGAVASLADLADAASQKRLALEDQLLSTTPDPIPTSRLFDAANSNDSFERAGAYQQLAKLHATSTTPGWNAYWRLTSEMEAHQDAQRNTQLEKELRESRQRRGRDVLAQLHTSIWLELGNSNLRALFERTAQALNQSDDAQRHAGYAQMLALVNQVQHLRNLWHVGETLRLYALISADQHMDATYREVPEVHNALFLTEPQRPLFEQTYLHGFVDLVRQAYVTRVGVASLAAQHAKSLRKVQNPLMAAHQRVAGEATAVYQDAYGHSGVDSVQVAGGVWLASQAVPVVRLGAAGYDEALGDQRRHGFLPNTALTLLKSSLVMRPTRIKQPSDVLWRSFTRLVGYQMVQPGTGPRLGWQLAADLTTRPRQDERWRMMLHGGALIAALASPNLSHHLLLSANASVAAVRGARADMEVAAPIGLQGRVALGAGPMNALRFAASYAPRLLVDAVHVGHRVEGSVQVEWVVAEQLQALWAQNVGLVVYVLGQVQQQDRLGQGMAELGVRLD